MNTKKPSKKGAIITAVVIILAVVGYFYYEGGVPLTSSAVETSQETSDAELAGQRVLNLLNQIKSLRIDTTMFSDPVYKTLRDYTVAIPQENVGRANPFAPIPGVPSAAAAKTH